MKRIVLPILIIITILVILMMDNIIYAENNECKIVLKYNGNSKLSAGDVKEIDIVINNINLPEGIVLYNGLIQYDEEKMDVKVVDSQEWELYDQNNKTITLSRKDLENCKENQIIGKLIITAKSDIKIDSNIKLIKGEVTDGNEILKVSDSDLVLDGIDINVKEESKYVIKDGYIQNVAPGTTKEKMLSNIDTTAELIEIYEGEETITDDEAKVGTGMTMKLTRGEEIKEYILIVIGDCNGSGTTNVADLTTLMMSRAESLATNKDESKILKGAYEKAVDLNDDGKISIADITKLSMFIAENK